MAFFLCQDVDLHIIFASSSSSWTDLLSILFFLGTFVTYVLQVLNRPRFNVSYEPDLLIPDIINERSLTQIFRPLCEITPSPSAFLSTTS